MPSGSGTATLTGISALTASGAVDAPGVGELAVAFEATAGGEVAIGNLPTHMSVCTIEGTFIDNMGFPIQGSLTFTPTPEAITDTADDITIVPRPVEVFLDEDGYFRVLLLAADDPDATPQRWTYTVTELFEGGRTYDIDAPGGETVNLIDVAPVPSSVGVTRYRGAPGEDGTPGEQGEQGERGESRGSTVALLGASLTYNNGDSTIQANPGIAGNTGYLQLGIATWANAALGQSMEIVRNVSHGGYTSAQILDRLDDALAPDSNGAVPSWVLGHDWWMNDIILGVSTAESKANILELITRCNEAGAGAILTDYLVIDAYTTTAMLDQHWAMLDWLSELSDRTPGFFFFRVCDDFVNPATGKPLTGYTYDGTHAGAFMARGLGERLAAQIKHLFPRRRSGPVTWNRRSGFTPGGHPSEAVSNPVLTGTPVAGLAPHMVNVAATASPTFAIRAWDDNPNRLWQEITFGANGYVHIGIELVFGAGLSWAGLVLTPGTSKLQMQCEFRVPSTGDPTKWVTPQGFIYYIGSSEHCYALYDTSAIGTDVGLRPDDDAIYMMRSPKTTMPAAATAVAASLVFWGQAGAKVQFRRPSVIVS